MHELFCIIHCNRALLVEYVWKQYGSVLPKLYSSELKKLSGQKVQDFNSKKWLQFWKKKVEIYREEVGLLT